MMTVAYLFSWFPFFICFSNYAVIHLVTSLLRRHVDMSSVKIYQETKEEREQRLDEEHKKFISSVASMRSLPCLRSTIAGAGGKTNESVRIAEEREKLRIKRMREEAEENMKELKIKQEYFEKVEQLKDIQAKKRQNRLKRKGKRAEKQHSPSDASFSSV